MARPLKKGLDYFPLDIDFRRDPKIIELLMTTGTNLSLAIYIDLLGDIYGGEGYYLGYNDDITKAFAWERRYDLQVVIDTINACINAQLFDGDMAHNHSVLTSKSIQERYVFIKESSRQKFEITEEYRLVNVGYPLVNVENKGVLVQELAISVQEPTDKRHLVHKGKESKLNKTKLNKSSLAVSEEIDTEGLIRNSDNELPPMTTDEFFTQTISTIAALYKIHSASIIDAIETNKSIVASVKDEDIAMWLLDKSSRIGTPNVFLKAVKTDRFIKPAGSAKKMGNKITGLTSDIIKCPTCGSKTHIDDVLVTANNSGAFTQVAHFTKYDFTFYSKQQVDISVMCTNHDCKRMGEFQVVSVMA